MSAILTHTETYEIEHCCTCGMAFAMTRDFKQRRINDHDWFYCPAGHSQHYTAKTEAQKQLERAERLERTLANRDESLRAERAAHAVTKGKLTKTKNRIANGVCPCCSRTFANLGRHMSSQHPDYEGVRS